MKINSIPRDYWDWRCSGLLLVLALPLLPLTWLTTDQPHRLATAVSLDGLVRGPAAVAAALCLWAAWRISAKPQLAWLAAIAAVVAIPSIVTSGLQLTAERPAGDSMWLAMITAVALLVIAWLGLSAGRLVPGGGEPLRWGVLAGLVLGGAKLVVVSALPQASASAAGRPALVIGYLALAVPATLLVLTIPNVPGWARSRVALGVLLYSGAHLTTCLGAAEPSTLLSVITLTADVIGATNLAAAGAGVLRMALVAENHDRDQLQLRVDELEAGLRDDRARIHEIKSTIAGVASASRMLRENPDIAADRRRLLDDMVQAELARLQRLLLADPGISTTRVVDLDTTIARLALAQEVRGNRVSWLPTGLRVTAAPDAVTEVLNILLDNAAKHGSSDTSVTVNEGTDAIEVVVSDDGPGIAPEVRPHLFDWGARGPRSGGQGIGLHIAHDLAARHGGHLRVCEVDGEMRGATFVATFPRARRGVSDEPAHIA